MTTISLPSCMNKTGSRGARSEAPFFTPTLTRRGRWYAIYNMQYAVCMDRSDGLEKNYHPFFMRSVNPICGSSKSRDRAVGAV